MMNIRIYYSAMEKAFFAYSLEKRLSLSKTKLPASVTIIARTVTAPKRMTLLHVRHFQLGLTVQQTSIQILTEVATIDGTLKSLIYYLAQWQKHTKYANDHYSLPRSPLLPHHPHNLL